MKLPIHCFKSTFSSMLFVLLAQCLFFSISSFFFLDLLCFSFLLFFFKYCLSFPDYSLLIPLSSLVWFFPLGA